MKACKHPTLRALKSKVSKIVYQVREADVNCY